MASVPQFVDKKERERVMLAAYLTARQLLDEMAANGGSLNREHEKIGAPVAMLTFAAGADLERCRCILAEMKADPKVWGAVLRVIPLTRGPL